MKIYQNDETEKQINQCLNMLKDVIGKDLLGIYLYGSAMVGGLQKYSDIDLFVITDRATTYEEKTELAVNFLKISDIYMQGLKRPIEMTIVNKTEINPWRYPPIFDFQYGDWLRKPFESGNIEPWPTKEMPDLAILVTQLLLASQILLGPDPHRLLSKVPYRDFMMATTQTLDTLMADLNSDTRNVLLTYARILSTVETDIIRSKPVAADWVIDRLPEQYLSVIKRAKAICIGEDNECWEDIQSVIQPCVDFILSHIKRKISSLELSDTPKSIKLSEFSDRSINYCHGSRYG